MIDPAENLYYAIGQLAYAIASADGEVQKAERRHFEEIIDSELKANQSDYDISGIIFKVLDKGGRHFTDAETAYNWAMKEIRMNSHYLSPDMKESFIRLIEKIAKAYPPVTADERSIIDRFRADLAVLKGDPIFYARK